MTLSQTLTGLNTNVTYGLSFWASGEGAGAGSFAGDGLFGLDVTGYSTVYLASPSGVSPLGQAHIFNFIFTPVSSSTDITFTNWGHPASYTQGWNFPGVATELVLDDVIVNPVPEPTTLALLGLGVLVATGRLTRRSQNTEK